VATRTFLALDIDEAVRDGLVSAVGDFPADGSKVRWVARQNLHVTLKFLGDVSDGELAGVCDAVAAAAGQVEPFECGVRGLQAVPPNAKVRMVWAEVHEPAGRMAAMFVLLEEALKDLSFEPEGRQFHPHITLGRVSFTKQPRELLAAAARHAETDFGTTLAGAVVVYASELSPRGPIYTPMARGHFRTV
jgi:2'-5' RNA ligase